MKWLWQTFSPRIRLFGVPRFDEAHRGQSRRVVAPARGFTMVESMLLVVILGMTAAVVGQSLTTMSQTAVTNNDTLFLNDAMLSQMEVLWTTYKTVSPAPTSSTPWTSSQTVKTPNGNTYTMDSSISVADPTTGMTTDLGNQTTYLYLQVQIVGGDTMGTYASE